MNSRHLTQKLVDVSSDVAFKMPTHFSNSRNEAKSTDSYVKLILQDLNPGVAYYFDSVCVKTKHSNWSDSMSLDLGKARLFLRYCQNIC